jgi:large subunit ribosomal protein L10e
MAQIRKANAYSKRKVTPFTRVSKRRQKSFIKVVPPQKIVKFEMGKASQFRNKKIPHVLHVISKEKVQIRHNAMEACRQYINKKVDRETNGQYFFKVVTYPHHIQREHKMLTGAGADRMSSGMQLSFGKSIGKSAILHDGSELFTVAVKDERFLPFVRKTLKQIRSKIPGDVRVDYEKLE